LNRFWTRLYNRLVKLKKEKRVALPIKDQNKRLQKELFERRLKDLDEKNAVLYDYSDDIDS